MPSTSACDACYRAAMAIAIAECNPLVLVTLLLNTRSLSALGDVLEALDKKAPHIPYRNSKLTHILQDSLSANSRTLMICAVSPTSHTADETLYTLQVVVVLVSRRQLSRCACIRSHSPSSCPRKLWCESTPFLTAGWHALRCAVRAAHAQC